MVEIPRRKHTATVRSEIRQRVTALFGNVLFGWDFIKYSSRFGALESLR
jgi:hypothetical protein